MRTDIWNGSITGEAPMCLCLSLGWSCAELAQQHLSAQVSLSQCLHSREITTGTLQALSNGAELEHERQDSPHLENSRV